MLDILWGSGGAPTGRGLPGERPSRSCVGSAPRELAASGPRAQACLCFGLFSR